MERHHLWVGGPDGGVEQCEGPAIGVDLASVLAAGLPPWRASFELLGALAEILAVSEEDGASHGRLDAEVVFVDDTGCVSVEGFRAGLADASAADRLALGVLALRLCGGWFDPGLPRTPAEHDEARIDAVLSMDLAGLPPGVEGDLQWLVARLLSADPAERVHPLLVWRACSALGGQAPGEGLEAFGRSVVEGAPALRAPGPRDVFDPERPSTAFVVSRDLHDAVAGDAPPNTVDWFELGDASPRRADGHGARRTELRTRGQTVRRSLAPAPPSTPRTATGETEFILGAPEGRTFRFERCLGAGGFGEVYLCTMTSPGGVTAQVAVKVLRDGIDPRAQAVRRLRDEARVLGALNHPAVLTAHDLVVLDGRVAMVTEYVPGADLDVCLTHPTDPPPLRAVLEVLAQAADALDACWNATDADGAPVRLVHRDIKPSNLRIGTHGQVKVLDFGIATFDTVREAKTQVDQFIGTPAYMPPERITDMSDLPAGDVYALAAVLVEAVTGRSLWAGVSHRGQYRLAMEPAEHDRRVDEHLASITASGVAALLKPCLRHDPTARPTARELSEALEDLADRTPGPPLRRWAKSHAWAEDLALEGSLVGRTLTERTLRSDSGVRPVAAPVAAPPAPPVAAPPAPPVAAPPESLLGRAVDEDPFDRDDDDLPVGPLFDDDDDDDDVLVVRRSPVGLALLLGGLLVAGVAAAATAAVGLIWVNLPGSESDASNPVAAVEPVEVPTPPPPAPELDPTPPADPTRPVPSPGTPVSSGVAQTTPDPALEPEPAAGTPGPLASATHGIELPEPGPRPVAASTDCAPVELEEAALAGRLTRAQSDCLASGMRDANARLVDRRQVGRVLLVDAKARCAEGSACPDYESLQREFFEELDRSDPEMMTTFARHLFTSAGSDVARWQDAYRWAGLALERKSAWSGRTRTERLRALHEIRAKAAQQVMALAPSDVQRELARDAAVEWAELLRGLNLDAGPAMELCAAVVGASSSCERRVSTEAIRVSVTFVSVPPRATVIVDGKEVGQTPTRAELAHGAHEVRMRLGDVESSQSIQVGASQPNRWQWSRDAESWKPFTD